MAGALGIQLGGRNYYDGVPQDRLPMGDGTSSLTPDHIAQASRIMVVTDHRIECVDRLVGQGQGRTAQRQVHERGDNAV